MTFMSCLLYLTIIRPPSGFHHVLSYALLAKTGRKHHIAMAQRWLCTSKHLFFGRIMCPPSGDARVKILAPKHVIANPDHDAWLSDGQTLTGIHHYEIVRNHRPRIDRWMSDPAYIGNFIRTAAQRMVRPFRPDQ